MPWQQLSVYSRLPQLAEELLLIHGALSVSLEDAGDDPVLEPGPGETPLWRQTRAVGTFEAQHDLAPVMRALRATLPEGSGLRLEQARLDDRDWVRVWLEDWQPQRFGQRLWITPEEKRGQVPDAAAVVVTLDPGLAFGTGTHPSTALCLEWLAAADLKDRTVLDYGCGSGILAVAALKLGARLATGVDIDAQAVRSTLANGAANGVADRLQARLPESYRPTAHDVVLANILAQPLIGLAPLLAKSVAPGGSLVLAGLLERQAADVKAAYDPFFEFDHGALQDGWQRLDARRRKE